MLENQKAIDQFCSYFERNIKEIETLNNRLYKKILIVILMDTLSIVWSEGCENKNKIRFCDLIRKCIKWKFSERISVPMTIFSMKNINLEINTKLKYNLTDRLNKMQYGQIYRLEIDPNLKELEADIINKDELNIIKKNSHAELLYTYRNNLVHEFREPGHGMEFSDDNESPYYHGMTHLESNRDTWELVYPTNFFINLAKTALISLKDHLIQRDLNPYSFYKFGTPW